MPGQIYNKLYICGHMTTETSTALVLWSLILSQYEVTHGKSSNIY